MGGALTWRRVFALALGAGSLVGLLIAGAISLVGSATAAAATTIIPASGAFNPVDDPTGAPLNADPVSNGYVSCAGGTFYAGAGICANINGRSTWYGAFLGVHSSSGFNLSDVAGNQVFCAEKPASGGYFPDPSYGYYEVATPYGAFGPGWLDALAFAMGQQYNENGGVEGSNDQGEGTKLAIDYGLFAGAYGSPPSNWAGATSAAQAYATRLINEANGLSGSNVLWEFVTLPNFSSLTINQSASIAVNLQSKNSVGVPDQGFWASVSGGYWQGYSPGQALYVYTDSGGHVPLLTFVPTSAQVTFNYSTTLPKWQFAMYNPSYSLAQSITGPAPVNVAVGGQATYPVNAGGVIDIEKAGYDNISTNGAAFNILNASGYPATYINGTPVGTLYTYNYDVVGSYSIADTQSIAATGGLAPGPYYAVEIAAPAGYVLPVSPNNKTAVMVTANQTTTQVIQDQLKPESTDFAY